MTKEQKRRQQLQSNLRSSTVRFLNPPDGAMPIDQNLLFEALTDGGCEFCGDEIENGPLCAKEDEYHYCARARKMETERGLP